MWVLRAIQAGQRRVNGWLSNPASVNILLVFATILPFTSLIAAAPVPDSNPQHEAMNQTLYSPYDNEHIDHRQLLIQRHEQISSGSVAAGFIHPTHLYRRAADALPAPNKAYNMTVTQGTISPDGFERLGFLMNGKFPADPFVWDENDDIEITVNNESPVPFAIHWHGIHQIGTPEMDGVPGLSQWNIYTGQSYTYRFKLINQHGGYWYHSHERGYYADGLRGTIFIRPKLDRKKPWSLISSVQSDIDQMEAAEKDFQVMSLSDHWHINHTDMLLVVHETGVPPACFDSLHINGRGRQYCFDDWTSLVSPVQTSLLQNNTAINPEGITSKGCISLVPPKTGYTVKDTLDGRYGGLCKNTTAPLTVFSAYKAIKQGRNWLNLQIIDTASNWYYGVSIDSHKMWIVAVDGHYIEPLQVDIAQITIGSRLSVMVELNPDYTGDIFPIRLTGLRALQPIEGHAFLSYIDETDGTWTPSLEEDFGYATRELSTAHVPMSGFITDPDVVKWQQNQSAPFDPISAVPKTSNMTLHAVASQNSLNVWQLASVPLDTAHLADERPMLFNATDGNATSNEMTPYATMPMGTVVDIIMENNIYSIVGGPNSPHPFHMHSRRFWIIGSGGGPFPADTVAEAEEAGINFNFDNPPLRDGFDIDANSWVVIRYVVDHAAANILHCHIDDHAIEGMAAVLLEGLETIPAGGNFSETIKARPANFVETQNDELGKVLEEAWTTGAINAKWIEPAATETSTPWGDPRALAQSIQLLASANSVGSSITKSLQSELSLLQASSTDEVNAITAVVSDYLTTFTGVATSGAAAAATATAVINTQQSTLNAAASLTSATVAAPAASTRFATTTVTVTFLGQSTLNVAASQPTTQALITTKAASSIISSAIATRSVDSSSIQAATSRATETEPATETSLATATEIPDSTSEDEAQETDVSPASPTASYTIDSTLIDTASETPSATIRAASSATAQTTQLAISFPSAVTSQTGTVVAPATTPAAPLTTLVNTPKTAASVAVATGVIVSTPLIGATQTVVASAPASIVANVPASVTPSLPVSIIESAPTSVAATVPASAVVSVPASIPASVPGTAIATTLIPNVVNSVAVTSVSNSLAPVSIQQTVRATALASANNAALSALSIAASATKALAATIITTLTAVRTVNALPSQTQSLIAQNTASLKAVSLFSDPSSKAGTPTAAPVQTEEEVDGLDNEPYETYLSE